MDSEGAFDGLDDEYCPEGVPAEMAIFAAAFRAAFDLHYAAVTFEIGRRKRRSEGEEGD